MTRCQYPDWEGGLWVDNHSFNLDGYCTTCGEYSKEHDQRMFGTHLREALNILKKKISSVGFNMTELQKLLDSRLDEIVVKYRASRAIRDKLIAEEKVIEGDMKILRDALDVLEKQQF